MLNKKLVLISAFTFITLVLCLLPIQPIQAVGSNLIEGDDGYNSAITPGNVYTYVVTQSDPTAMMILKAGDKQKLTITATNNSITTMNKTGGGKWIADSIYGITNYYNSTNGTWGELMGLPVAEGLISGYNSTHTYDYETIKMPSMIITKLGEYNIAGTLIIPNNFTAVNHTIVNQTYTMFAYFISLSGRPFIKSTPSSPNIDGLWSIMVGDGTNPADLRMDYIYNKEGINTGMRMYNSTAGAWYLLFEIKLEEAEEPFPIFLLLGMAAAQGGVSPTNLYIIVGLIVGLVLVIIIVIVVKAKK